MDQPIQTRIPTWTPRKVILATLVIVAVAIAFWLLLRFRLVVFSLFEAIVFSTALFPIVKRLEKYRVPRAIAIGISLFGVLLVIAAFFYWTTPLIIEQGATVSNTMASFYQQLRGVLINSPNILVQRLANRIPSAIFSFSQTNTPNPNSLDTVALGITYLGSIGNGIFATISVILVTVYWTLERDRTIRSLLLLFQPDRREKIQNVIASTEERVGAYIRGVAILSLSIGAMALIAYLIIGLPHALLLGLMAAVFEIVPIIGPILGALPAALVALSTDPTKVIWVIAAVSVIQFSENHLLVPRVMSKTVGVNPVVSLLAFAAFGSLFGLAGALLAVPMAVLIQILVDRFFLSPMEEAGPVVDGRGEISMLRYEVQELAQDVRKQVRDKEGDILDDSDDVEDNIEAIANDLDSILSKTDRQEEAGKVEA